MVIWVNLIALLCLFFVYFLLKQWMYSAPSLFVSILDVYKFYVVPGVLFVLNILIALFSGDPLIPLTISFVSMTVSVTSHFIWKVREFRNGAIYKRFEEKVFPVIFEFSQKYGVLIGYNDIKLRITRSKSHISLDIILKIPEKNNDVALMKSELVEALTKQDSSTQYKVIVHYPLDKKKDSMQAFLHGKFT